MLDWSDAVGHFYGWSLGTIDNGLQLIQNSESDPGVGPLPRVGGVPVDALGRPVVARSAPAPHAIYRATGADNDTLRAYYDASGNMMALLVHRPAGCGREDELGTSTPAAGGPDGAGCREGDDFRLLFAWDEVGNLLAVERQRLVDDGTCTAPGGGIGILDPAYEEYLGPGDPQDYEWCPAARLESTYDFGGQRRVKREANITDDVGRIPEGASLYVSASYEVRQAVLSDDVWGGEDLIDARYLWNEAGILFELDSAVPDGAPSPKTRLTLTNQIGSASSVLDADLGSVSQVLSQLPYGAEEQTFPRVGLTDPPAFVPRYEFTGKERDRGVGLVYFGARSLDARLGRWVSADPLAVQGSLGNAYAYAASNPVHLIDPVGLDEAEAQSSATQDAGAASAFYETPAGEAAQPSSYIQPNDFDANGQPDMCLVSDTSAAARPPSEGGASAGPAGSPAPAATYAAASGAPSSASVGHTPPSSAEPTSPTPSAASLSDLQVPDAHLRGRTIRRASASGDALPEPDRINAEPWLPGLSASEMGLLVGGVPGLIVGDMVEAGGDTGSDEPPTTPPIAGLVREASRRATRASETLGTAADRVLVEARRVMQRHLESEQGRAFTARGAQWSVEEAFRAWDRAIRLGFRPSGGAATIEYHWKGGAHINLQNPGGGANIHFPVPAGFRVPKLR